MITLRHVVIAATLARALSCEGAEYAGWTVGNAWNGYGSILRSTDSGVSWLRQGIGQVADVNFSSVVVVDPFSAWVVGATNAGYATIYHTTDGGQTWNREGSAAQVPDTNLSKVTAFGNDNVWAVGGGTILHSSNGGAGWTNQCPASYANVVFQGVHTPDGVNVWATGWLTNAQGIPTPVILKSSDGGQSWTSQTGGDVGLLTHVLGISAVDANTAWAIGGFKGASWTVLGTTNGGVTWTQQNQGSYDGNEICAVNASTVWAVSDYTIQRTTNGGSSWNPSSSGPYTMGISAVDSQQAWVVDYGVAGTIYHTTDGGDNWVRQTQLDGEPLPALMTISFSDIAVPEPSSVALLLLGLGGLAGRRRRS